ncbi:tyrosinase [Exaiptasia diaphana]|uniref:Tyrosinase n=1 Tax=Exaiptasia diaphana TaxID=2652724 RepID=A0A913XBD1_EXADI|nr:tyrosinase [Exaiptasia diaphana]KXJ13362.1 Tyrosinase [Exaiptasia diaphana]
MNTLNVVWFLFICAVVQQSEGQFPRICTNLESLKTKTCCPIPKNFAEPCGSDGKRGKCEELILRDWNYTYSHFQPFQNDDERHNWPRAMYEKTCKCNGNFGGYDCSKCEFGFSGTNCTKKKTLKRRNFLKLSPEEKDRYMRYINESKYFLSDYVVTTKFYEEISEVVQAGEDPSEMFHNVSNYDLFTWMHYYSARDTIYPDKTRSDIDFAHDGQGFPTWHRLYMLLWERSLQEIAKDDNLAVPYWDWTEHPNRCNTTICSKDLLGVTNQHSGIVEGKYLDKWYVICTREMTDNLTKLCDPNERKIGLERNTEKQKKNKEKERGFIMTFPTNDEVNFALRFESYDLPPYSKESSCNFRNILEGYVSTKTGYRLPNVHTLHNQVHIVTGGIMGDVPSASNDPIFPLHHSFVDRIYEKWLRKFKKDASVLSKFNAPIGHNKHDVIVPLFPVYTHQEMFRKSVDFGYEYEDVDENGNSPEDKSDDGSLGDCPVPYRKSSASGVPGMDLSWLLMSIFLFQYGQ